MFIKSRSIIAGAGVLLLATACSDAPEAVQSGALAPETTSAPASAASSSTATPAPASQGQNSAIDIIGWDQAELRGGLSAERLVGMDVRGSDGRSIGDVKDVLVNEQGQATAVVIESGGFLDIGDTHFRIPWDQAKLSADLDHVIVPLSSATAKDYRDTREREKVQTGEREHRVSELKNDLVTMANGRAYGRVEDFIIGRDGDVKAVVVEAVEPTTQGRYAYPYRAGAFDYPGNAYRLPYEFTEVNKLKPFDYRVAGVEQPSANAGATSGAGAGEGRGGESMRDALGRPPRQTRG